MKIILVIIVILGSWIGLNVYNDQKLFTNPLAEKSSTDKLIDSAKSGLDNGAEYLEEKGEALLEKSEELAEEAVEKGREVVKETKKAAVKGYNKAADSIAEKTGSK